IGPPHRVRVVLDPPRRRCRHLMRPTRAGAGDAAFVDQHALRTRRADVDADDVPGHGCVSGVESAPVTPSIRAAARSVGLWSPGTSWMWLDPNRVRNVSADVSILANACGHSGVEALTSPVVVAVSKCWNSPRTRWRR